MDILNIIEKLRKQDLSKEYTPTEKGGYLSALDDIEKQVKLFAIPVVSVECEHDWREIHYGSTGIMHECKKCGKKI